MDPSNSSSASPSSRSPQHAYRGRGRSQPRSGGLGRRTWASLVASSTANTGDPPPTPPTPAVTSNTVATTAQPPAIHIARIGEAANSAPPLLSSVPRSPSPGHSKNESDPGWEGHYGMSQETIRKTQFLESYSKLINDPTHSDMILHLSTPTTNHDNLNRPPSSASPDARTTTGASLFTLHAHQAICALHTEYFSNAVKHGFKEAQSEKGTFHFEEYDPYAILWVIKYLYTGDYDIDTDPYDELVLRKPTSQLLEAKKSKRAKKLEHRKNANQEYEYGYSGDYLASNNWPFGHNHGQQENKGPIESAAGLDLLWHIRIHGLADMLLIEPLKKLASFRFSECINEAQAYTGPRDNLDYLLDVIQELWENSTNCECLKSGVLRYVLSLTLKRWDNVMALLRSERYKSLMRETEFGVQLAEELLNERITGGIYDDPRDYW